MARSRREPGRQAAGRAPEIPSLNWRRFAIAIVSGVGALVAMGLASALGDVHGPSLHQKLFATVGALVFVVLAVVAVQSCAATLGSVVAARAGRAGRSGASAVKVIVSFVGYVIILFVGLGLVGVPATHLLIGGALTGVIVGIAAQQALGNVFAGLVLLFARPFSLDQRVRVRSGSLGGGLEGVVTAMNLAYVTIETDEGVVNVPNSAILAAGIGPAPSAGQDSPAPPAPTDAAPQVDPAGTVLPASRAGPVTPEGGAPAEPPPSAPPAEPG